MNVITKMGLVLCGLLLLIPTACRTPAPVAASSRQSSLPKGVDASVHIYLLRGIGRESGHWGSTFPDRLRHHFPGARLVYMDLPGAGRLYDQPALASIEEMADFLHQTYQHSLDSAEEKKVLLATSLAGNVALDWLLRYPADFSGAALVGTGLKGVCDSKKRVQPEAKEQFVDIFLTSDVNKREQKFLSINSNLQQHNDSLLQAWVQIQQRHPVSKTTLMKQTVAGMLYQPPKEVPIVPLLIVGSQADQIVAPECIRAVHAHLGGQLAMHPTSGHGIPIDAPLWLADTFAHWIQSSVLPAPDPEELISASPLPLTKDPSFFDFEWVKKGLEAVNKLTDEVSEEAIAFWRQL